jgi:hypothetical protein
MQLLDEGPFVVLSKSGKVSVEGATNQEDGKYIDDEEEESVKIEIDFFGKDGDSAGDDPKGG